MSRSVGVHEAKTHFSRLLAEVARGEEIVITKRGEEVARLVATQAPTKRVLGGDEGLVIIHDDFDAPLPPEIQAAFDGRRT